MKRTALTLLAFLCVTASHGLPRVRIIATGGTIAGVSDGVGYTAGMVTAEDLVRSVEGIGEVAEISCEQFCNIGSQDMDEGIWLALSKRVDAATAEDSVDAVVITHGTDTMEETAAFLALTLKTEKPVVITGAMRPSDAPDADGPANLLSSVKAAAAGRGRVICCMDGLLISPFSLIKSNTLTKNSFQSRDEKGLVGRVGKEAEFYGEAEKFPTFDISYLDSLPKVGIVYCCGGDCTPSAEGFLRAGAKGLVLAGVGNGNCNAAMLAMAGRVPTVRASRVPFGEVTGDGEVDDIAAGTSASHSLSPQQSRILLMLLLANGYGMDGIRECFGRWSSGK